MAALAACLLSASEVRAQAASEIDYADPSAWLCLPDRTGDACDIDLTTTVVQADGSTAIESWESNPDAPIDCFYVYPTVSTDTTVNSDMTPDPAELNVIRQQFARFGSVCRTYAPMYRQTTLAGLRAGLGTRTNYEDVRAAFHHYLDRHNQGRGFVLIGHSQGSYILRDLIAAEIDGTPLRQQLVSAILAGATVSVPWGREDGGHFENIAECETATDTGCLVAFASYRLTSPPPVNARFGRVTEPGLSGSCVSPGALLGKGSALHAYLDASGQTIVGRQRPGAWTESGPSISTPWVSVPGLLTGQCARTSDTHFLAIEIHGDPSDPRVDDIIGDLGSGDRIALDWGLHLVDMNLVMGDLIELVRRQGEAWTTGR